MLRGDHLGLCVITVIQPRSSARDRDIGWRLGIDEALIRRGMALIGGESWHRQ